MFGITSSEDFGGKPVPGSLWSLTSNHRLLISPAGFADVGYRNVQAQLSLSVRGRHRVRRDPHEPVARTHSPVGSERYESAQYGAHERVDVGGHWIHLSGYRECILSIILSSIVSRF